MSKLHLGLASNKHMGNNEMYLGIFADHPLFDPSFVYLTVLEDCLKYNRTHFKLYVNYWNNEGDHSTREKRLTVAELLEFSPEVQEFAKLYYPQHSL